MSEPVIAAGTRIDQSERVRVALLSGLLFVLGVAFVAMLIADEATAAGL